MSASQPIQHAAIQQYARQLYLTTVADQFASLAEEALRKKQSHLSYLEALLAAEIEERERRAVIRRIKEAHFSAIKTLEEFDFSERIAYPRSRNEEVERGRVSGAQGTGDFSWRNSDGEKSFSDRSWCRRLPATQTSALHHGGGNGD